MMPFRMSFRGSANRGDAATGVSLMSKFSWLRINNQRKDPIITDARFQQMVDISVRSRFGDCSTQWPTELEKMIMAMYTMIIL